MKRLILISFILLVSCKGNVFKDISNKTSADALYADALKLTDSGDYDSAYTELMTISTTYPTYATTDKFKKTLAGVQAGQCGLTFITLIDNLTHVSGSTPFKMLMTSFKGIAVTPQKCADAVTTMNTLSTTSDDQLLFLAVLGMAKVGTYLRARADRDGTSSLGDGSTDSTFDACDGTSQADRLTDADIKQIITGFGLILQNFALIGGSFSGSSASSSLSSFQAFCADPLGDGTDSSHNSDAINCNITDPTSSLLTDSTVRTFRRLINSSAYGIGTCNASQVNPLAADFCCPSLAIP